MKPVPATILLVEDNVAHAALVFRTLEEYDFDVKIVHVSDGESALDYLFRRGMFAGRTEHDLPCVILLDLRLPRVDGLEVLRQIKSNERLKKIPVVIMTTSSAERDVSEAYERHANSYLVKPVDFARFSRMMEGMSEYWLKWNYFAGV
ncbi:response regulator [Rhodocaloribacter litoris]|uniref:response regulator n=1 Tax=Rhodocaloribacter litoris TaxID=2558931 RepID=UPI001421ACE5|nr:response regulator [Rhodocaloribacter litoris]QXD14950.1 response regulator [Rhodocaloribacter litoris]GIV58948.1 MAG: response regulator [Rhodothermaceae bacterium]